MNNLIKFFVVTLGGLSLLSQVAIADYHSLENVKKGDVIPVTLKQLKPTQASVGYDQIYYKLGRYQFDTEKLFDEMCENNGQKAISKFSRSSNPADMSSYQCTDEIGANPSDMKTVVIGPDNALYLTDGHHTFNVLWHMENGGPDFKVHVVVADDYRHLSDMKAFWSQMKDDNNLLLLDDKFQAIEHSQLPTSLGLDNFYNNPYRALMYYTRKIAWEKPKPAFNYVEFYWGKEIFDKIDLSKYDLNSLDGYKKAVEDTAQVILSVNTNNVGGTMRSAERLGRFKGFDKGEFDKLFRRNQKIDYMLRYKKQLNQQGIEHRKAS
ncbi:MAG: ParB/Srx family N-terminal domain-containing protein [Methylophaga sp.]|nr:ParB/Srx family N-terminal domain-containing protein [Methylophaga sp.]